VVNVHALAALLPGTWNPSTQSTGGWEGRRAGLNVLEKLLSLKGFEPHIF
jgi:hypothetical protein